MMKILRVFLFVFGIMLIFALAASSEALEITYGGDNPKSIRKGDAPGVIFGIDEVVTDENALDWHLDGEIPPGIDIDKTGKLTGNATTEGTYTFTITVINDESGNSAEYKDFTLIVRAADAGSADSGGSSGGCNAGIGFLALGILLAKKISRHKKA